jgi:glycerol-3-phosphate acyltransferase PlsY
MAGRGGAIVEGTFVSNPDRLFLPTGKIVVDLLKVLAALASGYLLGSLNTAVIVGKIYGKDIRNHGSRSAGLTNTLRVLGKSAAAFVLVGDILKGIVACLVGLHLAVYAGSGDARDCVSLLAAGAGAVIGHNWPVYFGFKGGKGALTAAAVLFMFDWGMALACLGVFVAIVASTRYVSLGTMSAALVFVVLSFIPLFGHTLYFNVFACLMAAIVIFKHRENVQRLLSGTENKLAF